MTANPGTPEVSIEEELIAIGMALVKAVQETADVLARSRDQELHTRFDEDKAKQALKDATTEATVNASVTIGRQVSPATGRSNKEYAEALIARELLKDDTFRKATAHWQACELAHLSAQTDLSKGLDQFAAVRSAARLTAAMLYFAGDHEPTLSREEMDDIEGSHQGRAARPRHS